MSSINFQICKKCGRTNFSCIDTFSNISTLNHCICDQPDFDEVSYEEYREQLKKEKCPKCGSDNVVPIVYGDGPLGLHDGKWYGGCHKRPEDPEFRCMDCNHNF